MSITYVAVHGGAGVHSSSSHPVKHALRRACTESLKALSGGSSATGAVGRAMSVLEDEECLNAGYGSNLTLDGTVECDAAIMDGQTGDFGSVGAVSGVKNPIKAAYAILEYSRRPSALGRIPPMTLVSDSARLFAVSQGVETVPLESLVSPRANADWQTWKKRLELSDNYTDSKSSSTHKMQDTVGAIAWDATGGLAAGVSSGGLLLKTPGRIGEAAVFGAGCWVHQKTCNNLPGARRGIACSVSGAGEYITRYALARSIGEAWDRAGEDADMHEILERILVDHFWTPSRNRGELNPNAGVLLLTQDRDDGGLSIVRLWCAFTTESMAIAYASSKDTKPKATILRRSKEKASPDRPPIYITALTLGNI